MTRDGEILVLREHLATGERLAARMTRLRERLGPLMPMTGEKLRLKDGKPWADVVRVRNELAHEYPLDPDKQTNQVNAAWEMSFTLFETASAIRDFVKMERLLEGDL